jgi:hemoglobin/transferrin/lactoferrin receptor protein
LNFTSSSPHKQQCSLSGKRPCSIKSFDKYRQGSVFIEPEILKKITVDKGPHNVEVGNGGFGGKVTLETKDATDLLIGDNC